MILISSLEISYKVIIQHEHSSTFEMKYFLNRSTVFNNEFVGRGGDVVVVFYDCLRCASSVKSDQ